jgi:SAM-dependent methyltransferase
LDVVRPEVLYGNYIYVTTSSLGLVEHFKGYSEDVMERITPPKGSLVVDVGSNDGSLLRFFKAEGMTVLGVDPAREISQAATASGIETHTAFFTSQLGTQLKKERGGATIVTANNVYSHADDLGDLTDGIRNLLAPDGVFVFEVIYMIDMIEKPLFDTIYHEHLCYHTVKPLNSFLERHGLQLIDIKRLPIKGGTIRGTAQLIGGPREVSPSVGEIIALEDAFGVEDPETYKKYADYIEKVKNDLMDVINDVRSKGKTVAGYGASSTTTVLMHHYGLGDILEFLADDNPRKQHLYSPGHHIPVLPSEVIYERNPDYIVVLAWNYAEPIMAKHQKYLDQGGHFIIPLPEVKII